MTTTVTDAPRRTCGLPLLRPYQALAGRAVLSSVRAGAGRSFSIQVARQGGKNELSAQLELLLLVAHARTGGDIIKCAPTFRPQLLISMRRLWSRITEARLDGVAARDGNSVRLGRARVLFLSAEAGANVVGHTASLLLEVDEAQDVEIEKFDREFRPMAAARNATTVFYGTPWRETSLLARATQEHREAEQRDGVRRHFSFDWGVVAACSREYGRFVEAERARLGEQHPVFVTQYCLRTLPGAGRLFGPGALALLCAAHARQRGPAQRETYVAGLDLAGGDGDAPGAHDATVLTIGRVMAPPTDDDAGGPHIEIVEHVAWTAEPHERLVRQLIALLRDRWNVAAVAVDATGLGETIARLLVAALGTRVQPVKFTAERKSQLGFELLAAVNGGRLRMYADDGSAEYGTFWREATAAQAAYRANRTMNFFVAETDGHDDYVVSAALLAEAARGRGPRRASGRVRE